MKLWVLFLKTLKLESLMLFHEISNELEDKEVVEMMSGCSFGTKKLKNKSQKCYHGIYNEMSSRLMFITLNLQTKINWNEQRPFSNVQYNERSFTLPSPKREILVSKLSLIETLYELISMANFCIEPCFRNSSKR